jgi:beta-glucosidase
MIEAAVQLARTSDVVVIVLGDDLSSSSEWGDRDSLDLSGSQMPLLAAIANESTPCVLVHIGGRTATFGPDNAVFDQVSKKER